MSEPIKQTYLIHDSRTGMKLGEVEAESAEAGAAVFAEHHNAIELSEADDFPATYKMKRTDGKVAYFKLSPAAAAARA